jgi:hypothetical protein
VARFDVVGRPLAHSVASGQAVGSAVFRLGTQSIDVPVRASTPLGGPSLVWRLLH